MTIGNCLKDARETNSFLQEDIAKRLNVSEQYLNEWETDKRMPDAVSVLRLAGIYHTDVYSLLKNDISLVQQLNEKALYYENGEYYCLVSFNDEMVEGEDKVYPKRTYVNQCNFSEHEIVFSRMHYSATKVEEVSTRVTIPYEDIQEINLYLAKKNIHKGNSIAESVYLYELRILLKSGLLVCIQSNASYAMKKVFAYLQSKTVLNDSLHMMDQFIDEKSFYGDKSHKQSMIDGDTIGFQAYASKVFNENEHTNSLHTLQLRDDADDRITDDVLSFNSSKTKIQMTDAEKTSLTGGKKTVKILVIVIAIWIFIAIMMLVIQLFH
jgi:transcriptional regulator with XRE-family HTH domain